MDPLTGQPVGDAHLPHKPADDTEQVYYEGSPMMRAVLGKGILWFLGGLLLMAAGIAPQFIANRHIPVYFTLAGIVLGLICFVVPFMQVKTIRYRISNYRVDFERGWFSKDIDTIELWHIADLHFHQSFGDRVLGVGNIEIKSHDETMPLLVLHGLPNPRPLFETLKQRVIAVKRQSGVVKMDTGS